MLGSRLRAWTKSRLLQCCINVHVSVESGQNMNNKKKKREVHKVGDVVTKVLNTTVKC